MPTWLAAGLWGLLAGGALIIGAGLSFFVKSIVLGVTMIHGGAISVAALAAVFLSNVPEGLSSAAGMKRAGRSPVYIFGVWGAIVVISAVAALLGFVVFRHFSQAVISATTAVAAGAILAMIADTMIPEAFEETQTAAGLVTVVGFLAAFALTKLGG